MAKQKFFLHQDREQQELGRKRPKAMKADLAVIKRENQEPREQVKNKLLFLGKLYYLQGAFVVFWQPDGQNHDPIYHLQHNRRCA